MLNNAEQQKQNAFVLMADEHSTEMQLFSCRDIATRLLMRSDARMKD